MTLITAWLDAPRLVQRPAYWFLAFGPGPELLPRFECDELGLKERGPLPRHMDLVADGSGVARYVSFD